MDIEEIRHKIYFLEKDFEEELQKIKEGLAYIDPESIHSKISKMVNSAIASGLTIIEIKLSKDIMKILMDEHKSRVGVIFSEDFGYNILGYPVNEIEGNHYIGMEVRYDG